jgi:hypothetical protein
MPSPPLEFALLLLVDGLFVDAALLVINELLSLAPKPEITIDFLLTAPSF